MRIANFCFASFFFVSLVTSCNRQEAQLSEQAESRPANSSESRNGMVATAHPLATAAGVEALEKGGNAADAAVAAAFALSVVEPSMSGIGGRMQAIVLSADGNLRGIDATTQAPYTYDSATAPQASYGYPTIGIPGVVAGLAKLNKEHGSMPLSELIQPAISYAENGFKVSEGQARMYSLVSSQLMEFEGSRMYYIKSGDTVAYEAEDMLVQKDLASTLRKIAEGGPDEFYRGSIARSIVDDVQANGGVLTMESLAQYEALNATIVSGSYRGIDMHSNWIPSFGAITIEILHILEHLPMSDLSEGQWASAVSQAIALGYEDRGSQFTLEDPIPTLTDKEYARGLSEKVILESAEDLQETAGLPSPMRTYPKEEAGFTTHLTVADDNGMVISLTQSLGPIMGSKVATPGLGFMYAATLGGYLGPMEAGQRASSHISPMIFTVDGLPFMGIGAAGGSRIPTAIVAATSRIIDRGMTLSEALAAPRVYPEEDGIMVETHEGLSWNPEDLEFLRDQGLEINEIDATSRFGRIHAIMYLSDIGLWIGAADPDWMGSAAGPNKID